MRKLKLTAVFCLFVLAGKAQQNYDAALIPQDLKAYASAVIRYSNQSDEVKDLDNSVFHLKRAITILNRNGDEDIVVWHNKTNTIKYIKGTIYDASGKAVKKFAEKDFEDSYAGQDFSLFEDSKVEHYEPAHPEYPYTVEYEYEVHSRQSLEFETWRPSPRPGVAVEKSIYSFISKPDFKINYKEMNIPPKVNIISDDKGSKVYSWEVDNLKAIKPEPLSPNPDQFLVTVKISPEKFTYEGIPGQFTNWQELGKWDYDKLLLNRDKLPSETVSHIKDLTDGISDPKLKAKKIYEYMQQKTRYISIQVGIGGYQPFLAADVDKTGYGDCKALVNYTGALLKAAGINSWYCMVEAGSRKISLTPDFASMNQGNHIILCLPFKNDTTWLECTSQKIPFGYLGDFTDDRWVLACTPEGGKLLHTPHYAAETNLTARKGDFTIDDKGNLTGNMVSRFSGVDFDERDGLTDETKNEQIKRIKEIYPVGNLNIESLEFNKVKAADPVITENIKLSAREFAPLNAGKYYFKANLANRLRSVPNEVRNRTTDVYINRGYTEDDEITYTLPAGYHNEKSLENRTITRPFGRYRITMTINNHQLTYKRRLQINDGTYSKEMYQQVVDFYQAVTDADSYTMALVKDN